MAAEPERPRSLAERLRDLPVAIQGIWVGIACIVLLVGSAAALRSLFSPGVSAVANPAPPAPTASAIAAASSPSVPAIRPDAPKTAAPASTLAIGGSGMGDFGALAIRDRMSANVRLRHIAAFMDDLEKLVTLEPSAMDRTDVRQLVINAATFGMTPGPGGSLSPDAQRLFNFLTGPAGTAGPDILFELVTTRGGSRAATYADELLRRPDIRAKGTPAFRIAYDLRTSTSCQDRVAMFERVKTDGDRRSLLGLFQMARCGHGPTDCCLTTDPAYKEVVRVINAKK